MKKTFSITLGGRIFSIEEDGYLVLDNYLKRLRTHFAHDPSVDELLKDIEFSFGEKFSEKLSKDKLAVTLEDVEAVIAVMGQVEEIAHEVQDEEAVKPSIEATATQTTKKRLYRNTDQQVIAGVCSGIATYFDIDPLVVRLLALALILANGIGILIYVVLWIAIPRAETSLQKLEMLGKTPSLNEFQELTKEKTYALTEETGFRRVLNLPIFLSGKAYNVLQKIVRLLGSIARVIAGIGFLVFPFLFATFTTIALIVLGTNVNSRYIASDLPLHELAHDPMFYIGLISGYLLIIIPLVLLATLGVSMLRRKNQFQALVVGALVTLWIFAAGGTAGSASQLGPWVYTHVENARAQTASTLKLDLPAVDKVIVSDTVQVTIRPGETYSATFSGRAEDLALIHVTTSNGLLQITQSPKKKETRICIACFHEKIAGVITMPHLNRVIAQGNSLVRLDGFKDDLDLQGRQNASLIVTGLGQGTTTTTQRLTLLAENTSDARLSGNIDLFHVTLKDNSRVDAESLDANTVEITAEDNAFCEVSPLNFFAATSSHNSFIRSTNGEAKRNIVKSQNGHIWIEGIPEREDR
jgi:phage shock protein PspC (stress-responsive transcriptional regulator)